MALDKQGNVIPAFRPDNPDMYGGGRMTNFIATIARAYLGPFHGKSSAKHQLSGYMDLVDVVMPDGGDHDPMTRRWSAGFFTSDFGAGTYPSNDGVTPAGGTIEDYRALANGDAAIQAGDDATEKQWTPEEAYRGVTVCGGKVRPDSEWDQLLKSIFKAPVDGQDEGVWGGWGSDATCLHGLRVEFILANREGSKAKGKGSDGASGSDDDFKTLVVARILSGPGTPAGSVGGVTTGSSSSPKPSTVAPKPAAAPTATKPATPAAATANGNADLDTDIATLLIAAAETAQAPLTMLQAAQVVLKAKGPAAVQRVKEKTVHETAAALASIDGKVWTYDGVKMALTAVAS